jgi:hypothetical protein
MTLSLVFLAPDIITAAIEGRLPHGYRYVENARRSDRAVAERPLFGAKRPAGIDVKRTLRTADFRLVQGLERAHFSAAAPLGAPDRGKLLR